MVDNANVEDTNQWNDPVVEDTLFSPVTKGLFWGGFGVLGLATLVMSILSFLLYLDATKDIRAASDSYPWPRTPLMVFFMVYNVGALIFSSAFVVGGLAVSRAPAWARVTMLSVAGLLLVGGSVITSIFLGSGFN